MIVYIFLKRCCNEYVFRLNCFRSRRVYYRARPRQPIQDECYVTKFALKVNGKELSDLSQVDATGHGDTAGFFRSILAQGRYNAPYNNGIAREDFSFGDLFLPVFDLSVYMDYGSKEAKEKRKVFSHHSSSSRVVIHISPWKSGKLPT